VNARYWNHPLISQANEKRPAGYYLRAFDFIDSGS